MSKEFIPIVYKNVEYLAVEDAFIMQDGNVGVYAIRTDEKPDDLGAADLYLLKYVLMDPEDFAPGTEWYDNVDWDEPDDVDKTQYGWIISEGRRV